MNHLFWFTANSDYGYVYVGIKKEVVKNKQNNEISLALQMAMAMREHERLIQEVENWLKVGLKLRPTSVVPLSIYTLYVNGNSTLNSNNSNNLIIGFNLECLVKLPAPVNLQIETANIIKSQLTINLKLAELTIDKKQYEKIEKGCILLIPESFENKWHIQIDVPKCKKLSCSGILKNEGRTICIEKRKSHLSCFKKELQDKNSKNNENSITLTVDIKGEIRIPFESLLCWRPDNEIILGRALKRYLTTISYNNKIKAYGHLISIAEGHGVFIES
jgi:hypothetical protein